MLQPDRPSHLALISGAGGKSRPMAAPSGLDALNLINNRSKQVAALDTSQWIAVLSVIAVVVGWFTSSWLQSSRERKRRQDEMRVAFLAEGYERLALISNRSLTDELAKWIEIAVAKIQLFGDRKAIKLVHRFLDEWAESEQKTGQGRAKS